MNFKHGKLTESFLGEVPVKYATWVYHSKHKCYFDIIITEQKLMIVGMDIVVNCPFKRISDYGVYFGDLVEDYGENYYVRNGCDWEFGSGEFIFFINEMTNDKEWFISFPNSRKEDLVMLYKVFEKFYMKAIG